MIRIKYMFAPEMLKRSVIVSAHPDDEILWFSSILDKVDRSVLCFLDCKSKPHWGIGRKQSISAYPMKNVSCMGIDESEAFNGANWQNPVITDFGIEIHNKNISDKKYRENYYKIKKNLENMLMGYCNVFTHNPWGEYGHEDHIQIYRVVKELQRGIKFNLWFSNYCSNKAYNLMLKYISGFNSEYITLETNKILASKIKNLYKENGCWTWYDNWEWFNEESFMKDEYDHCQWYNNDLFVKEKTTQENVKMYGHIFPLNFMKIELSKVSDKHNIFINFITRFFKIAIKKDFPKFFWQK